MLNVTAVPIFTDNYVWVIHQPGGNEVLIVDPGDPAPIIAAIKNNHWSLGGLLITHSHFDHIGGIAEMLNYKKVPVYGPDCAAIPLVDNPVGDGDVLSFWGIDFNIMGLPGHLPEHIAYVASGNKNGQAQIFSADIIFSAGCGRIFNGTHKELKYSLDKIKSYPKNTLVYPAHEYTASNLCFAAAVEPENRSISRRIDEVTALRNRNIPSLPTNLALELDINPFIRCGEKAVVNTVRSRLGREPIDENEVFKTLRLWKDGF